MELLDKFTITDKHRFTLNQILDEAKCCFQRRFDNGDYWDRDAITRLVDFTTVNGESVYTFEVWGKNHSKYATDYKKFPYWIEIDPETSNPTGNICWGTYPGDEPAVGSWILVKYADEVNKAFKGVK